MVIPHVDDVFWDELVTEINQVQTSMEAADAIYFEPSRHYMRNEEAIICFVRTTARPRCPYKVIVPLIAGVPVVLAFEEWHG